MEAHRRSKALSSVGVAMGALLLSCWGVAGRDLAGDEQNMLYGTPAQILEWSLDPRGGFVGHLPLSFWTRWMSLSIFSEAPAWAWRLHAVLFTTLTAALTTSTAIRHLGRGAGVLAGLLFLADPIGAFHAQEASNYACSALTGVLIVRGLLDLGARDARGAVWLAAGLCLGAANDFYSVLLAGPAAVVSLAYARERSLRRPLAAAWLTPLVAVTPFALLFVLRLFDSTGSGVLDVHADPLPPRPLPTILDAPWRVARRFFGAHLQGYAGGRNDAPWMGLPPVLWGVGAAALSLRGRAWPAAAILMGALGLHGLLGIGLEMVADRALPFEPRTLMGLTPALAITLSAVTLGTRPAWSWSLPVLWLLGAGASTLEARLSPADLRDRAIHHARQVAGERPLVIPDPRTRTRAPDALPCLPRNAHAAVVVSNHTSGPIPACDGDVELSIGHRTFFDAPVHEGSAASFLPRRVVTVYGGEVPSRSVHLHRSALDGLDAVTWTHTDAHGATLARVSHPSQLAPTSETSRIAANPTAPPWLPDHPLFRAHRNQVQAWELDPLDRRPTLRAAPLVSPWLTTLRRLLPVGGLVLAIVLSFRRRT